MTVRAVLLILAALAAASAAACADGNDNGNSVPGPTVGPTETVSPTVTIAVSADDGSREELTVELARTPAERGRGLMNRDQLPEGRGMLFVFPEDSTISFWMKDTLIPLSIAFIASGGTILDIQDMEPLSTELHRPPEPYRYALEVSRGWFDRHGFETGDRVEIPEDLTTTPAE